jgi:hypothetical protein
MVYTPNVRACKGVTETGMRSNTCRGIAQRTHFWGSAVIHSPRELHCYEVLDGVEDGEAADEELPFREKAGTNAMYSYVQGS